jgi:cytidine deaminase
MQHTARNSPTESAKITLPADSVQRLLAAALAARARAYAPYSGYAVGAALLDENGAVHAGCNVENAAYPQGWCAEATALGVMVMAAGHQVHAVLVAGSGGQYISPCGGCRQKLREFAEDDIPIFSADDNGIRAQWTLGELLPASFGPAHLAHATQSRVKDIQYCTPQP